MSGWQPIETAPKDGTKFDAWMTGKLIDGKTSGSRMPDVSWGPVAFLEGDHWRVWDNNGKFRAIEVGSRFSVSRVTHWMEIPKGPIEVSCTADSAA